MIKEDSRCRVRLPQHMFDNDIEWKDREKVFVALFMNLTYHGGWNTTYYINAQDCGRILAGHASYPNIWKNLREIFVIGVINEFTISVTPKKVGRYHAKMPVKAPNDMCIIKDVDALLMWYYLVGRLSAGNVVEDHSETTNKQVVWTKNEDGKLMDRLLEYQIEWPKR